MAKLLPGLLPNAPKQYDQQQMNQILRQITYALNRDVELKESAEEHEAMAFFLTI